MHVLQSSFFELRDTYARLFVSRAWVYALSLGFALVVCSLLINYFAGLYATMRAGPAISDTLLDMIPKLSTAFIHEGTIDVRIVSMVLIPFFLPQSIPVVFNGFALVVFVRALFVNMTQLGLYHDATLITSSFVTFGGDLFFSGHVAHPIFFALAFWKIKIVRYFFLASACVLGVSAIAGHYHYSIDVFAAPFFSYGLYKLCVAWMPEELAVLNQKYGL